MGVEGSGKTTVGKLLAQELGWRFVDADDFHSASNKEKMSHGIPLDDADRGPWLRAIHDFVANLVEKKTKACGCLFGIEAELSRAITPGFGNEGRISERQFRSVLFAVARAAGTLRARIFAGQPV